MNHCHLAIALLIRAAATPLAAQTVVAPTNVTAGDVATFLWKTSNQKE
jgi:hypothetical protein